MIYQFVGTTGLPTPPFEDDAPSASALWERVVAARAVGPEGRLVTRVTILDEDGKPTSATEETGNWDPFSIKDVAAGMDELGDAEGELEGRADEDEGAPIRSLGRAD
jgi:hypothetical protein